MTSELLSSSSLDNIFIHSLTFASNYFPRSEFANKMPITTSQKAAGLTCVCATITITAISVFILSIHTTSAQECHQIVGPEALDLLSTKRPYRFNPLEAVGVPYTPEGCEAEKLWYFGRHGTRYPGVEDIVAMQKILPRLFNEIVSAANGNLYI